MENLNLVELTQKEMEETNGGICVLSLFFCLATAILIALWES
jgi:hypothetical protein